METQIVELFNDSKVVLKLSQFIERYRINLFLDTDKSVKNTQSIYNRNIINIFELNVEFLKSKGAEYLDLPNYSELYKQSAHNSRIINKYETLTMFTSGLNSKELLDLYIYPPSTISVPYHLLSSNIIQTQGNFQIKDITLDNVLQKEIDRLKLRKQETTSDIKDDAATKKRVQKLTVLVWSKSYADNGLGTLLNITPFVENLQINSGISGSSFSFNLPPITASYNNILLNWDMKNIVIDKKGNYISKNSSTKDEGVLDRFREQEISRKKKNEYLLKETSVKAKSSGSKKQNYSELYFFEKIISNNDVVFITLDEEITKDYQLELPFTYLTNKSFDFIGLVDQVPLTEQQSLRNVNVSVSVSGRDLMKLLIDDNTMFYANAYANTENNNIFFNYQDIVNERSFLRNEATGYMLELADQREYTISYLLNFLISRISNIQICPDDLLYFIKDKSYFYKVLREYNQQTNEVKEFGVEKVNTAGIWQCTKLIVDDYAKSKRVFDPNLQAYQGSLLNYVNKVCQKPFVEFFGDTYNDKFLFIARKPPFDEEGFLKNPCVQIYPHEVKSMTLKMDDTNIYSWYNLKKTQSLYTQDVQTNFLTAVFFPELAELFGSKPYEVQTLYVDDLYDVDASQKRASYLELLRDFRYLIESTVYLPFTRKGTITLIGNSVIKKGMNIWLANTSEFFYVDSVSHRQVSKETRDYTTTVSVSRGMVQSYISKNANNQGISYFNLVEFSDNFETIGGVVDTNKSIKINQKVLKFFLNKKQFS
jgi:hypothetical protein